MSTNRLGFFSKTAAILALIVCSAGCSQMTATNALNSEILNGKPNAAVNRNDGFYIALEYPISLHPAIASGLNLPEKDKALGYDRDLLGLASSVSKMYTRQLEIDASISASVAEASSKTRRYKTTYDTIQYASYPMEIEVPVNDKNDCLYIDKKACKIRRINLVPLIGAGVRVTAEYESDSYGGSVSLAYLSAKASTSNIRGNVQLQFLGVNRLGPNSTGITQLNLTPDSIAMIQQQIASMMAQMWYKDTIIQPQIIGYTILGAPDLSLVSQADIIDQVLRNVHSLSNNFFETLLQESIRLGDIKLEDADIFRKKYEIRLAEMTRHSETALIAEFVNYRLMSRPGVEGLTDEARRNIFRCLLDELKDKGVKDFDTKDLDTKIDKLMAAANIKTVHEKAK